MDNRAQHNWWLTFSAFQKSREKTWAPILYKNLRAQIQPTINILHEHGLQTAISFLDRSVPMERLAGTIKNIYIDAGRVWGGRTYQMVNRQAEKLQPKKELSFAGDDEYEEKRLLPIGRNEELINEIINYYRLFLLTKAVIPITQKTRDDILSVLVEAQQQGLSIQNIVDRLENPDFTRFRARRIARTETGKASSWAAVWGARKTGYKTKKLWISSRDPRTRRIAAGGPHEHDTFDHLNMNGVMVDMDEAFQVPKKTGGYELMMHPHDPNGSPGDVIMCRCAVGFKIITDHAGRPLKN